MEARFMTAGGRLCFLDQGFFYETHLHTSEVSACAESSAAEQVRAYKKRGYAGIIVTDHFINGNSSCPRHLSWEDKMRFIYKGYANAKKEGDQCGLDVFLGWEYAIHGVEFLTYGLGLDFLLAFPKLDKLPIEKYSALVRENGGYLAQAHPFRKAFYISDPGPAEPRLIDGLEVYNASMPDYVNKQAYRFAQKHKLAMQAGTDSHYMEQPLSSGIALKKKAGSIKDIIHALMANEAKLLVP
jgi:hypothetical protein